MVSSALRWRTPSMAGKLVHGAGGFLGSWVVNLLLCKGYVVHGTVKEPKDEKNAHLSKLENASENLKLFKADLLDYNSMLSAIEGCNGVFHVASPVPSTTVPNPEVEVVETAIKGTLNVLKACLEAKVKRVVFVSSAAAVGMNPKWSEGQVLDEICWSDKEYCKTVKMVLYKNNVRICTLTVVSFLPALSLGPILQSNVNASSLILLRILKEGNESMENKVRRIVDVRDVAEALLLAYEKLEAEGRYICTAHAIKAKAMVDKLRGLYPHYNYPNKFADVGEDIRLNCEKLQTLGWRYRPLDETLIDSVKSYEVAGLLD
ncbi:hypothetical protein FNV43_RR09918 [Rhamnella rubrinervis]|uniref:NAD-dependent epimerase/dehydratase domain-containing protein n=1 Tax=Rhamnella rubrinervis TaxID=2594499 RepID=A0A8K0HC51_9ROSA|nr:hypothetical protein FNV43_RR09918 [Rhamnella rubrinervis]